MAKAKSGKSQTDPQVTDDSVEPMVLALAEQLGTFLGRVQAKADGWLENEQLRQQVSQIRDNATQLLDRVNRASVAARRSTPKPAKKSKSAASATTKGRSGGAVDAQGKRHRRPPPRTNSSTRGLGSRWGSRWVRRA